MANVYSSFLSTPLQRGGVAHRMWAMYVSPELGRQGRGCHACYSVRRFSAVPLARANGGWAVRQEGGSLCAGLGRRIMDQPHGSGHLPTCYVRSSPGRLGKFVMRSDILAGVKVRRHASGSRSVKWLLTCKGHAGTQYSPCPCKAIRLHREPRVFQGLRPSPVLKKSLGSKAPKSCKPNTYEGGSRKVWKVGKRGWVLVALLVSPSARFFFLVFLVCARRSPSPVSSFPTSCISLHLSSAVSVSVLGE